MSSLAIRLLAAIRTRERAGEDSDELVLSELMPAHVTRSELQSAVDELSALELIDWFRYPASSLVGYETLDAARADALLRQQGHLWPEDRSRSRLSALAG